MALTRLLAITLLLPILVRSTSAPVRTNTFLLEGLGIHKNYSNDAYIFSYVLSDIAEKEEQMDTIIPRHIARLTLQGVSKNTLVHRFASVHIPSPYPSKRKTYAMLPRYYYMQLKRSYDNGNNQSFVGSSIMVHDAVKKRTYRTLFTHTDIYDLNLVYDQDTYKLKWLVESLNRTTCALVMREVNWFKLLHRLNDTSVDNEDETYEDLFTQHCLEHDRSKAFVPANNNYTLSALRSNRVFTFTLSYKLVKVYSWQRKFNDEYTESSWSGKFFQVPRLECYEPKGVFVEETQPNGDITKIITIRITCPENKLDETRPPIYFKFNPYDLSGGILYRPAIQIPPTTIKAISFLENENEDTLVHFTNPNHLISYHSTYLNRYNLLERNDLQIVYDRPKFIYKQIPRLHSTYSYGLNVRG